MRIYVDSEWTSWDGTTRVKLSDGSEWVQDEYYYQYRYCYRPEASIDSRNKMTVAGMNRAVRVKRA